MSVGFIPLLLHAAPATDWGGIQQRPLRGSASPVYFSPRPIPGLDTSRPGWAFLPLGIDMTRFCRWLWLTEVAVAGARMQRNGRATLGLSKALNILVI